MDIKRIGAEPSSLGPAANFTGHARRDPIFSAAAPSALVAGAVTFEAGARTVWHTHPVGQLLVITAGVGRVQAWGGPIEEVHAGDSVWFAPGEKHWHGAAPRNGMSHIAIVESKDGKTTDWMEPVTAEQYGG